MPVARALLIASLSLATVFGGVVATAGPAGAAATTRYVATTGDDGAGGANDCTDQSAPCRTVQHAVDQASAGDTISIASGTYTESVVIAGKSLDLIGAASGPPTITGTSGAGITVEPGTGGTPTVTLTRLELSDTPKSQGLLDFGSDVRLSDSTVTGNASGGAIAQGGSIEVTNSDMNGNDGLGLGTSGGDLTVSDSTVSNNVQGSNAAAALGFGVVVLGSGSASVTRSVIAGNASAGLEVTGTGTAALSDSTLSDNGVAGVANGPSGTVTVQNSTLSGNHGAGIFAQESSTTVTDSTIAGTTPAPAGFPAPAGPGGVVYFPAGPVNRVFPPAGALNIAGVKQQAPQVQPRAAAADPGVTLTATIVADQQATVPDCDGSVVDAGDNLSSDAANSCGFGSDTHSLSKADPNLGALAGNGGPTKTLLPAKPSDAIDVIAPGSTGCSQGSADQRGVSRPQGVRCDIGAVEVAQPRLVITPAALPHGTVGTPYRVAVHASGGLGEPYAFALTAGSALPPGLSMSSAGVISGTPTKAGTYPVTVAVDDPTTKAYTIVITAPAPGGGGSSTPGGGTAPGGGTTPGGSNNLGPTVANTGSPAASMTALGAAAVFVGLLLLWGGGLIGRDPARRRGPG